MIMIRRIIYILVIISIHPIPVFCQDRIDSLELELNSALEDSSKIRLLLKITEHSYQFNPAKATFYANQCLLLAEKIGYKKGIADSYYSLGVINKNKGRYEYAIDFFTKSKLIYEEIGDKLGLGHVNNGFGSLWFITMDYQKAFSYFEEANNYFTELNDSLNIASTFLNMGNALDVQGQNEPALKYFNQTVKIFEGIGDKRRLASAFLTFGEHYESRGELSVAENYYRKALNLSKQVKAIPRIADSYFYLGRYFFNIDEYQLALHYFDSAFTYARESESLESMMDNAEYLEDLYKYTGDFPKALFYSELYSEIRDSINKTQLNQQLSELEWEQKLEFEKQIGEKESQKQKLIRNFILLALVLMILLAGFIFRSYQNKQKANRLLAEIDELKSRMFSNISHEFRTPLTLILGPLDEMIEEGESQKPSAKTLKMMQRNASRLLTLVNQMLDLSKMDAGKLKLELVENDIVQTMRAMILSFSSLAEQKHIHFEHEMPDYPCITWFDPDKLEKIINNLLSNAFKFTSENGIVKVVAKLFSETKATLVPPFTCENPVLELSVEDTGKGIPKEHLEKVFDRFHQVEGTSEIEQIGTGIGLALTKELLNLMHGNVTVESTHGKGSTFKIILPLGKNHLKEKEFILIETEQIPDKRKTKIQEELQTAPGEEIISNPDEQLSLYTDGKEDLPLILIVDDHPDIRTHVRQKLKKFRVLEAADGKAGLDISIEYLPDLIVTDLMMPNMDGVEFCKKLKTDERTSHIPVIMLTAKASVENRIEGLETGADDYITKPFNMKELLTRINNLIEQRRKLRERFSREVTLQPKDIAITSADEKFLNRTIEIIEKNMGDGEFDVASLREEVGLSHMQLFRKLKALTDQAPGDFIRTIRLKRAAQLMQQKFGNIAEITYEVGFNNLSYFAKCFREMFGMSPSDYIKNN
jgi:signal transduction histidine kinase/DNA-binding response OmpR family regulator